MSRLVAAEVAAPVASGFAATIREINPVLHVGRDPAVLNPLVGYYTEYCKQLGVTPGDNLTP